MLLPYILYLPSGAAGICPSVFFCFSNFWEYTLDFWQKLEESYLLLRVPLSIFGVRYVSWGGLKLWANFISLYLPYARATESFLPHDILGGLRFCHQVSDIHPLICRRSIQDLPCPKRFPSFLGIQNYWSGCSAPASDVLRSLLPDCLYLF